VKGRWGERGDACGERERGRVRGRLMGRGRGREATVWPVMGL